jgi:tRNA nucleotidyltransferase (CCA-adding enzyme)
MLRAVRFAAQLGFGIERETLNAIPPRKDKLTNISAERIREEFSRLLTSPFPDKLLLLEGTGLLPFVLMGREFYGDLSATAARLAKTPCEIYLRLTIFLSRAGGDAAAILRDLRFDNKTLRDVSLLIQLLPSSVPRNRYEIKRLMARASPALTEKLMVLWNDGEALNTLHDILASGECFNLRNLAVNGDDLIKLGIRPGERIGAMLSGLLDAVMREPELNDYDRLIRIIQPTLS